MRGIPPKSSLSFRAIGSLLEDDLRLVFEDVEAVFHHLTPVGGGEPRSAEYTGLKALMLAVLEDGILSYLARGGVERAEAETWIAGRSRRSPFSFPVVCETLGLEPSAVRIALRRLRTQSASVRRPIGRSRPNVRRAHRAGDTRIAIPRLSSAS